MDSFKEYARLNKVSDTLMSMLTLDCEPLQDYSTVLVQDEPALDIALPQIFEQPPLTHLERGKLPHIESVAAKIWRAHKTNPSGPLGPDYQELVNEFQPLFAWTMACWDYLLTTEGCRFILRHGDQRFGVRGDYRALTDKEYSRMVHGIFRQCVLEFAQSAEHSSLTVSSNGHAGSANSLSQWLRNRCWPLILEAYRRLDQPADPRQRTLTPYSYLRCVPYQFLNEFHQKLVYSTLRHLPLPERRAIETYFLQFHTEDATATALGCPIEEGYRLLRQGLIRLLIHERLVYCLLRQIERY
jgi:hypothetical protein